MHGSLATVMAFLSLHWEQVALYETRKPMFFQRCNSQSGHKSLKLKMWFSSVQSFSHVRLFATPWIAACQAFLSITNSWSSPRLASIESVMPSSHLILCHPLLLLPPIPPSIRVFSNESTLHMRRPKYWSFSAGPYLRMQGIWVPSLVREPRSHMPQGQENWTIKQKQYCNKFNKHFKNGPHKNKLYKKKQKLRFS